MKQLGTVPSSGSPEARGITTAAIKEPVASVVTEWGWEESSPSVTVQEFRDIVVKSFVSMKRGRAPSAEEPAREECSSIARKARDMFRVVCDSADLDQVEVSFGVVKDSLEQLWDYAVLRRQPFRDLLALVEAAIKTADVDDLNAVHKEGILAALTTLCHWFIDPEDHDAHVRDFAERNINVLGPLVSLKGKRLRVTFEEVKD